MCHTVAEAKYNVDVVEGITAEVAASITVFVRKGVRMRAAVIALAAIGIYQRAIFACVYGHSVTAIVAVFDNTMRAVIVRKCSFGAGDVRAYLAAVRADGGRGAIVRMRYGRFADGSAAARALDYTIMPGEVIIDLFKNNGRIAMRAAAGGNSSTTAAA